MRDARKEEVLDRRQCRIGEFIDGLAAGAGVRDLEGGVLTGFTVRMPTVEDPSLLIVVRAVIVEAKVVAFVGAFGLGDGLLAWRARQAGKGMKWREDVPWGVTEG